MTFEELDIGTLQGLEDRNVSILRDANITTIGALMRLTSYECRMVPRLGQEGFKNVATVLLEKYGKHFKDI